MPVNELDSTRALVTLEEARLFSLRSAADRTRDEILIDAVNSVSVAIWTHCEREFLPTEDATRVFVLRVRSLNGSPVGWIDLAPYDLRSVTSVTLYTDQDVSVQDVLTTSEYRLRPVGGARGGTYTDIVTVQPAVAEAQPGFQWEATVVGDWGMSSVPSDVKLAALQWIDNIVKNPGSFASMEMSGYQVLPELDQALNRAGMPAAVRHRLRPYCRAL